MHRQEASWLQQLAQDVVDVYPRLPEIERQLAKTGETTKNIKTRLTVRQVVKELTEAAEVFRGAAKAGRLQHVRATSIKADESTVYRWIKTGRLPGITLSYSTRIGTKKQVTVITRADVERLKATRILDETAVATLQTVRKISRASAERAYRRLCQRLDIAAQTPLKSDQERKAICEALRADAKVLRCWEQWKDRMAGASAQKRSETDVSGDRLHGFGRFKALRQFW